MNRLRIRVLPSIVNALVLASAFSAGNSYVYCASRSLFGLALEGKAPRFLTRTNRQGVPYYCVLVVLLICLLAFLQVSNGSATVLAWFVNLVTPSQLINFAVMCGTFLCWLKACKAQGLDRDRLPYKSRFQPFAAWYGLIGCTVMAFVGGYTVSQSDSTLSSNFFRSFPDADHSKHQVFLPGYWYTPSFIFSYFMIALCPILFVGWKVIKRTRLRKPHEVDLKGEVEEIDEYTRTFVPQPYKYVASRDGVEPLLTVCSCVETSLTSGSISSSAAEERRIDLRGPQHRRPFFVSSLLLRGHEQKNDKNIMDWCSQSPQLWLMTVINGLDLGIAVK